MGSHVDPDKDRIRSLSKLWRSYTYEETQENDNDVFVAFSSTFTDRGIADFFGALLLEAGHANPRVSVADYNQVTQICLNHRDAFGTPEPEAIVILFRLEDLSNTDDPRTTREATDVLLRAVTLLREQYQGMIVLSLPPKPRGFTEGISTFSKPSALMGVWYETLTRIHDLASSSSGIYTVDLEEEISRLGEAQSLSPRDEMLYRQPYSPRFQLRIADRLLRIHAARKREPKKCIVVDCDNTLWGGIIGEDGLDGISLSDDFPGRPYREFQRQLKKMRDSGIFLAVCSKNNPADVDEIFERHSGMILKRDDISSWRVNWEPKSKNLAEIAKDLNIGLDSLVFIDDNPFEIDEVGTNAPGVTCLTVPEDATDIPTLLKAASRLFDRLEITSEDLQRVAMVRHEAARNELAQQLAPEQYLASLDLKVTIIVPDESDIARVTQLVNKTNQFNATSRRYTAQEITAYLKDPTTDLFCVSVEDRFGEYGIVGVAILKHFDGRSEFDTLLMSCRVLARGIESAIISFGIELARRKGSKRAVGEIIATKKNGMVADLFLRHGFELRETDSGRSTFDRSTDELAVPEYIQVVKPDIRDDWR
ncbi:HAD-IIIC family phosphatase [Rhizobium sp. S-51]|uniref:HAD-IIIC family phosphatase n=1 Tax=Rhizobium terricola TaxID=2728849 RepID=A0A7Y0FWP0_9HYPH|nr:HAD-IIIC family phosphatase [Rhizobium terricola]NML75702.1 HAD-IIIC family phosphatase [Rhizobium terricola]